MNRHQNRYPHESRLSRAGGIRVSGSPDCLGFCEGDKGKPREIGGRKASGPKSRIPDYWIYPRNGCQAAELAIATAGARFRSGRVLLVCAESWLSRFIRLSARGGHVGDRADRFGGLVLF